MDSEREERERYEATYLEDPNLPLPQIPRQMSKGLTGETFYDYDLPLSCNDPITILHFNDVYNIQPNRNADGTETGGISRFLTALRHESGEHPLILFSGDAFNPSLMSATTRGRHMVPFLNMLRIHTAVFGNHDFDFGVDHLEYLAGSTRFPWLLSNVCDAETGEPLANGVTYRLFEWQNVKIGILGLVEYEWLSTLATIEKEEVIYKDFVKESNRLCALLRAKEADLIIALTHMRAPNDERLAREALDIDLILGGHDHEYYGVKRIGKTVVCKSGSDFREFTKLVIYPGRQQGLVSKVNYDVLNPPTGILTPDVHNETPSGCVLLPKFRGGSEAEWECIEVSPDHYANNRHVDILVGRYQNELLAQMDKIIGVSSVQLETRFTIIRTQETNAGNWLCDLMRKECKAQIAVLNSGTIRADCVFPPGPIRMRDLSAMLPMIDLLMVVELTGVQLLAVLENGVCMYPKTEGRFLQVSGVRFEFDPRKEPGKRVDPKSVEVLIASDSHVYQPLDLETSYSLATKEYLCLGKDGFDVLVNTKTIRDSEETPNLPTMVRNAFSMAALANGFHRPHNAITSKRLQTLKTMNKEDLRCDFNLATVERDGQILYSLSPILEGRIRNIASC